MSKISMGVDRDEVTTVVFTRAEDNGSYTVLATLRGDAAEYVAQLEEENERLMNKKCAN